MSYLIKMPQMGLEMEKGEVVSWEVDVGEEVAEGDIIATVESEKAANDVEAREDGAVREIVVPEKGVVEPGDPIGIFGGLDEDISDWLAEIDEAGSGGSGAAAEAAASSGSDSATAERADESGSGASGQAAAEIRATPGARDLASEHDVDLAAVDGTGPQGTVTETDVRERVDQGSGGAASTEAVRATPGAKRLAGERDVDLTDVEGTGPQGVVTEDDVEQYEPTGGATESSSSDVRATPGAKQLASERGITLSAVEGTGPQGVVTEDDVEQHEVGSETGVETGAATRTIRESRQLSGMQQTIGDRMSRSHRNAPHVTLNRSFDATAMQNVAAAADQEGVDVSLTDILLAGVGAQLAATPAFNALYEDGEHKLVEEVNVGVAVDVDDGLVTPVVPSVAAKSVEEIAAVRGERTERALSGEFEMADMEGGTFTVTNLGMFGVDSFDPIINPPEVAILGVGRLREDGTMTLSLSFDHRVVNGADAARFLDGIVGNLTDAKWLTDRFDGDVVGALIDILAE